MSQPEHSFLISEEDPISAAVCHKFHFGSGLSLVRLEDERQMAVSGQSFAANLLHERHLEVNWTQTVGENPLSWQPAILRQKAPN